MADAERSDEKISASVIGEQLKGEVVNLVRVKEHAYSTPRHYVEISEDQHRRVKDPG